MVCFKGGAAFAAVALDTPILLLDPGMHADPIQKMVMDQDERIIATISLDKTVRIWKLSNLQLWKTIRVPMVSGSEGKLNALALSPSGNVIAVGGDTCRTWTNAFCIYLFDTQSGKMQLKVSGLPEQVNDLAFSKDGQYLAAVMANGAGLRVFRTNNGQQVAKDTGYGGSAFSVKFSPKGKIVTTCHDGKVRLYDSTLRFEFSKQVPQDFKPQEAIFSPDGEKIAVSFLGKPLVSVFSTKNMEILYLPDMTGVTGILRSLAWSVDGKSLYGAGEHMVRFKRMVRWWSDAGQPDSSGKGAFVDIPVTESNIQRILSLKDGGIVFTSLSSALGQVDSQGFLGTVRKYPNVIFPKCRGFMKISPSGDIISFPMTPDLSMTGVFALDRLQFSINQPVTSELIVPKRRATSFNLKAKLVNDNLHLEFEGQDLPMLNNEDVSCFSIARDERFFVVSTNTALRMYDRSGEQRWRLLLSSPLRALNITENGKFAIVALFDGTVNWYHITTGRLVLSLFIHADRGEWVAWTPDYYYSSSKNAENYLGWHANVSLDQAASFTPVAKMKAKYNKPSIIQKILRGGL
ncbi:MAG TPA: hypothetical protein HPQ00_14895 [Magnetococcales bacterium]|nr:hypothetical protein [Magnetococcales bacterium]